MEHQRVVLDFVQATSFKEQSNMALEFFAMYESFFKALHDDFFFVGELIWMLPVHGRENRISEFVFNAVDNNGIGITIYQVQQFTVFEFERRVLVDKFCFDLELQDCHCFLDLYV